MAEPVSTTVTIATEHGSRYLQQLAKHWAHKFATEFDPTHASIVNDEGKGVELDASASQLSIRAFAADAETLAPWRQVVEDHIARFAFREELTFDWTA
ncbi:DUF2218 domain-containing protein [Paracoccus sulfuroxidans]|uniref:DUF2218 domain-containing protein n=1 Tax=Paracoccus sulfuroxidans TaxID=384678 RepID=A0A562P0C9_9RHOB|nr:DUF2218 domain-containing protein [Paracoccus sulfuroxidans]TWI37917.1 hypothetical protein IQ24_00048 [Paracoccus sulfuroxidans]